MKRRLLSIALMLVVGLPLGGCTDGSVRSFLLTSHRIVKATDLIRCQVMEANGELGQGCKVPDGPLPPAKLSTEATLNTLRGLRQAVTARKALGELFAQYTAKGALSAQDKADMQANFAKLEGSLNGLSNSGLPSPDQASISYQVTALKPVFEELGKTIDKLKVNEKLDLNGLQMQAIMAFAKPVIARDGAVLAQLDAQIECKRGELIAWTK